MKTAQETQEENKKYAYKAVCVDFDGTLAEFADNIEDFGEAIPGGAEAINELHRLGYKIIIHTARPATQDHLDKLAAYLRKIGIHFDEINQNSDALWPTTKPVADLYIDDRALRFTGNWQETLNRAKNILGLTPQDHNRMLTYQELLAKVIVRAEEVGRFEHFLRTETSWITSPASTRFHLAKDGGLVEHSINVANTLLRLRATLATGLSEESCVISALYHDIGKIGWAGKPYYLPQTDQYYRRRGILYTINKECTHMDIATRSLYLVGKYISLTEDEAQAIRYHDGQYIEENHSVAHQETKLTRLLQYADNWSGGVIEDQP